MACKKAAAHNCENCEFYEPNIYPETRDFLECFRLCDMQLRVGMGGPFALDWQVVIAVGKSLGMNIDARFFRALKVFEATMIDKINNAGGKKDG